jgi:hypothetical protein
MHQSTSRQELRLSRATRESRQLTRSFLIGQVVSSTGEEVFFKIKRSTKLSKLQGAYANKVGKDVANIRCGARFFLDIVTCVVRNV